MEIERTRRELVRPAGRGFFPLDEELGLTTAHLAPRALEGLVRLSTWVPFRRATDLLAELTGVQVSEATARRWTEEAGATWEYVQTAQAEQIRRDLPEPERPAERLRVACRRGVCAAGAGRVGGGQVARDRGSHDHSSGPPRDDRAFVLCSVGRGRDLQSGRARRDPPTGSGAGGGGVCGAGWGGVARNRFVDDHRADALRILDFAHAAEYVSQIGQAVAQAGTNLPATWLNEQLHTLKHQGPTAVLAELRTLSTSHPDLQGVNTALAYLQKREGQMQYPRSQAQGWPIGSGSVESGHKVVMQARLKGPGMHWARRHVNPMLALRTAECNERWGEAWAHVARWRADQRRWRRRQRAMLRLLRACWLVLDWYRHFGRSSPQPGQKQLASSEPKKEASEALISRRPAATHPWRRPLLSRRCLAAKQ